MYAAIESLIEMRDDISREEFNKAARIFAENMKKDQNMTDIQICRLLSSMRDRY